jgi:hypothetical protein
MPSYAKKTAEYGFAKSTRVRGNPDKQVLGYSFGSLIIGLDFLLSGSRVHWPGTTTDKGKPEMSELHAPFGAPPEVVEQPADVVEVSPRTPVLITEQQVQFATAAAVPLQPAKTSRRWTETARAIGASLRAAFATSSNDARPKRQHYPSRNDFLEDSRMAREMLRL